MTTLMAQGPVDVNVGRLSPDDLMRLNPNMAACAGFLIEACKKTSDGRKALSMWDRYRGMRPTSNITGARRLHRRASVLMAMLGLWGRYEKAKDY